MTPTFELRISDGTVMTAPLTQESVERAVEALELALTNKYREILGLAPGED